MSFNTLHTRPTQLSVAWDPARAALVSLFLLTEDAPPTQPATASAWLAQTAAQLSPEQRRRNTMIFTCFGEVLTAAFDDPPSPITDFGSYLNALAQLSPTTLRPHMPSVGSNTMQDFLSQNPDAKAELESALKSPQAARDVCVTHLRELWTMFLNPEWQRHAAQLKGLTSALKQPIAALSALSANNASSTSPARSSAIELTRRLLQRELPEWALTQLAGVSNVVVVLSPHVALYVSRFGQADTAYVFTQFDNALMRSTPVQRAEVLVTINALADEARLKVLELLAAHGEMRGQEILAELDVSQPNVSRHLKQLVSVGLVEERRAGDANKLYRFQPEGLRKLFHKLSQLLSEDNASANASLHRAVTARTTALSAYPAALRSSLDDQGRVMYFSTKPNKQRVVLDYVFSKFVPGRTYSEQEATDLIDQWLTKPAARFGIDAVTLRRALVDEHELQRTKDGSKYWREAN